MNSIVRYARQPWSRNLRLGSVKRRLTAEQVAAAERLWAAGVYKADIARRIGVGMDVLLARLHDQLAHLPRRKRGPRRGSEPEVDPTPEEIEERAAAIRATWSEEEREARRCGSSTIARFVRIRSASRAGSARWRRS